MATDAQIAANIRNAQRSTGPTTPEGKEICRRNALKHGMASDSTLLASAEPGFALRKHQWRDTFRPEGDFQEWSYDRLVAASLRVDRCGRSIDLQVRYHAERSDSAWDIDRALDAARVASRLAIDPVVTVRKLRATSEGCRLICDRWNRLGEALDTNLGWTDAERSAALDLLGVAPDLRVGPTRLDPGVPGLDLMEHRRKTIRQDMDRLEDQISTLASSENLAYAMASTGGSALLSAPVRLLLRYEREAKRDFREARMDLPGPAEADRTVAIRDLDRDLSIPDPEPSPEPSPEPEPEPEPAPRPAPCSAPMVPRSPAPGLKGRALLEAMAAEARTERGVSFVDIWASPPSAHPRR